MKSVEIHGQLFEEFLSREKVTRRIALLGRQLTSDYSDRVPLAIIVLNGSFVFAADLLREVDLNMDVAFIRLRSYDGMVSSEMVQTILPLEEDPVGRHILIIEDIVDTGRTLNMLLTELKKKRPASIKIVSFLVKPTAMKYPIPIDYLGFEISDVFVVGYGLDFNGSGRNLPDVYRLKTG